MGAPLFAFLMLIMCLAISAVIIGWIALCFYVGERRSWHISIIATASLVLPVVGLYFVVLYAIAN